MKSNAGYGSKIVCHDTLPLAIAVGGMAEFTVDDKETVVTKLLREQFVPWTGRVNLSDVMRWGTAVLLPLVKEANAAWSDEPPMKVSLIVGLCNGGRAESGVVEIQNGVEFVAGSLNKSAVNYPATLPGWYADRFVRGKPDPFRDKVHDPAFVVAHAKEILEDAIMTDKRRSKGKIAALRRSCRSRDRRFRGGTLRPPGTNWGLERHLIRGGTLRTHPARCCRMLEGQNPRH